MSRRGPTPPNAATPDAATPSDAAPSDASPSDTAPARREWGALDAPPPTGTREQRMQALADAVWRAFGSDEPDANDTIHVSWVGFYFGPGAAFRVESSAADAADLRTPGDNEMLLGPSRNKPACSPIGLHGACGRAFRERRTLVVRDVADLGEHYVACDPRDRSELVIPCFTEAGEPYAVLDLDSFAVDGFTDHDAEQLKRLLHALQLTH